MPISNGPWHVVADIFISYSKQHPQTTRDVAAYLESEGYSVWWDTDLKAGERFGDVIDRELDAAKAVIVIWTARSVASDWVLAEAEHAHRDRKLIPLRARDLDARRIPKPYNILHTDVADDRAAILAAVKRLVGEPQPTTLILPAEYRVYGVPIYVAGTFNNWLNAKSGHPKASVATLAKYRLKTVRSRLQITLSLPPGEYEFKFLTREFEWLPWVVASEHERGEDTVGGPNFHIRVG
jgi:hypothetical protein